MSIVPYNYPDAYRSYYSVLVGWCGYYFIYTCANPLPQNLTTSNNTWNSLQVSRYVLSPAGYKIYPMQYARTLTGRLLSMVFLCLVLVSLCLEVCPPLSLSTR